MLAKIESLQRNARVIGDVYNEQASKTTLALT